MPSAILKLKSVHLDLLFAIIQDHPKLNWSHSALQSLLHSSYFQGFGLLDNQDVANLDNLKSFACFSCALDEAELVLIATKQQAFRRGFAENLLEFSILTLSAQKIKTIFLEVRASNQSAIDLYTKFEFEQYGIRKRYYKDGEDALLYRLHI